LKVLFLLMKVVIKIKKKNKKIFRFLNFNIIILKCFFKVLLCIELE
jgi:hypothetical protein